MDPPRRATAPSSKTPAAHATHPATVENSRNLAAYHLQHLRPPLLVGHALNPPHRAAAPSSQTPAAHATHTTPTRNPPRRATAPSSQTPAAHATHPATVENSRNLAAYHLQHLRPPLLVGHALHPPHRAAAPSLQTPAVHATHTTPTRNPPRRATAPSSQTPAAHATHPATVENPRNLAAYHLQHLRPPLLVGHALQEPRPPPSLPPQAFHHRRPSTVPLPPHKHPRPAMSAQPPRPPTSAPAPPAAPIQPPPRTAKQALLAAPPVQPKVNPLPHHASQIARHPPQRYALAAQQALRPIPQQQQSRRLVPQPVLSAQPQQQPPRVAHHHAHSAQHTAVPVQRIPQQPGCSTPQPAPRTSHQLHPAQPMQQPPHIVQLLTHTPVRASPPPTLSTEQAVPQVSPTIPTKPIVSPMAGPYWHRLHALLEETHETRISLVADPAAHANKSAKGPDGATATELQGHLLRGLTPAPDPHLGAPASYGVNPAAAYWAATRLSQHVTSRATPSPSEAIVQLQDAIPAADHAVDAVRVHVWESELTLLPSGCAERVVAGRRRMRKCKQRVDLCIKILSSLEGRGRRSSPAALDNAKLALEKANAAAAAERARRAAAREAAEQRVRKAAEKAERKTSSAKKEIDRDIKKRKRTKKDSAAADLMMRFVKKQNTGGTVKVCFTDTKRELENTKPIEDSLAAPAGALPLAPNKDAVSVSWWLLSEIPAPSANEMDRVLKGDEAVAQATHQVMQMHLRACAEKRFAAQDSVHRVLRNYRCERNAHLDDLAPRFSKRRSDLRGRGTGGPVKLLQFDEDNRPAFYGTCRRKSSAVRPRRPLAKDVNLDYSVDSADEWEEEEDGEDLMDVEMDRERANEDLELRDLFGSDDEDDDFLGDMIDDTALDDDDDGEDSEAESSGVDDAKRKGSNCEHDSQGTQKPIATDPGVIDLTKNAESSKQKVAEVEKKVQRRRKRSNRKLKQPVEIEGVSVPVVGEASPLDNYAVTSLDGAPTILMFNPYITHVSNFLQETSPPKPAPARIPRTSLDEDAKLDLASVLLNASSRTSRDSILYEFCERRRSRGAPVPPKIEIVRAIRVIGVNEKRNGDKRAGWYLKDTALATKLRERMAQPGSEKMAVRTAYSVAPGIVADVVESCTPARSE